MVVPLLMKLADNAVVCCRTRKLISPFGKRMHFAHFPRICVVFCNVFALYLCFILTGYLLYLYYIFVFIYSYCICITFVLLGSCKQIEA